MKRAHRRHQADAFTARARRFAGRTKRFGLANDFHDERTLSTVTDGPQGASLAAECVWFRRRLRAARAAFETA